MPYTCPDAPVIRELQPGLMPSSFQVSTWYDLRASRRIDEVNCAWRFTMFFAQGGPP